MDANEERSGLAAGAEDDAFGARLKALVEYRALVERQRRGEAPTAARERRAALRDFLERTGGIPRALAWNREGRQGSGG